MAEITANERTRAQAARLRALREHLGLSPTEVAARLGYQTSQGYLFYEKDTPIRLDRIGDWAAAFELPEDVFFDKIVGRRPLVDAPGAILRDRLAGQVPEADIDALVAQYGHERPLEQDARARTILQLAHDQRTQSRQPARHRPG